MKTRKMMGLAIVAGILLTGCSSDNVGDLEPGDCFTLTLTTTTQMVSQVPTIDCTKEHTHEVFFVTDLPADTVFDEEAIFSTGADLCLGAFEGYVGVDYFDTKAADLDIYVVYPLKEAWDSGERGVTCSIIPLDSTQTLTGSMRNAFADD